MNILYCPKCYYRYPHDPNVTATKDMHKCADCGANMRIWDTSDGTEPPKRTWIADRWKIEDSSGKVYETTSDCPYPWEAEWK